jgi:HAD superfamily hydrolase (TIGR01549 family)
VSETKTRTVRDPAILFDLDGTLVDTAYEHMFAWASALRNTGVVIPHWKIHRRIGMSGKALVRQLLREHGASTRKVSLESLERRHDAEFTRALRRIRPLPGAKKLLQALSRWRVPWAIATTGNQRQTSKLLKILGLSSNVVVVTGDDVDKAKPAPDIFVAAAGKLDMPIEHCIVVGDSVWDMLAAGRRRALSIGILGGGYSKAELEQSGAFRVYTDPADMLDHIEDLGVS